MMITFKEWWAKKKKEQGLPHDGGSKMQDASKEPEVTDAKGNKMRDNLGDKLAVHDVLAKGQGRRGWHTQGEK